MKQVEERYISFETSKMAYRDIKNSVDTAKREGIEIGMEKGMKKGREEGRAEGKHEASMRPTQKQHNVCWQWDFLPNRLPKLPSYLWKSLRI